MPSPVKSEKNARPRAFLKAFRLTGSITRAADACGIDRTLHYRWLKNQKYAEAFHEAYMQWGDMLEGEGIRRSVEGVLEPVFYQGAAVGAIRKYSDGILMRMLPRFKPEYALHFSAAVSVTGSLDLVDRLNAARKRVTKNADPSGGDEPGQPGPG